jgi:ABC-2 type transport system permease protein
VREKERGTMESLRATPLVAIELLAGKMLPYLFLSFAAAGGALLLAHLLFDVPIAGSVLWLGIVTLMFLGVSLGWGILISTLADSQQVAFQLALLSSMLPTFLLSGFIFPISSMPRALQILSHAVPARYYLAALRGIVLKGAGPEVWWSEAVGLAVYGVAVLGLATARTVRSL